MKKMGKIKSLLAVCMAAAIVTCAAPVTPVVQNQITVTAEAAAPKLSLRNTTLLKGATINLRVKNTKKKVKWYSSNKKVATVNAKGKVKAKGYGKATITAKVGGKKLTCKVTVVPTLSVSKTSVTIPKGGYADVKVTYMRPGTMYAESMETDRIYGKWMGWKGHVATLRIFGREKGTATVKFSNTYDNKTCAIKVTVK